MRTLREEAEFFRLSSKLGLIAIGEFVAWADRAVSASKEPPIEVIEVSLAGRKPVDEVQRLLEAVPGRCDPATPAHQVLGLMRERFESQQITLEVAVGLLLAYQLLANVAEDERLQAENFSDDLFLIRESEIDGWTLDDLKNEVMTFWEEYALRPDFLIRTT